MSEQLFYNVSEGPAGSFQTFLPSVDGTYEITAIGAVGGGENGGNGAEITGTFNLVTTDILTFLVGQGGEGDRNGGGGGGTFVFKDDEQNLLLAAGGGGGSDNPNEDSRHAGVLEVANNATGNYSSGQAAADGNGGEGGYRGGGGGGYLTDGAPGDASGLGGKSLINGGEGGQNIRSGGYGGGGGSDGTNSSWRYHGGGGGYSGGEGASAGDSGISAGGGGSFNGGQNKTNTGGLDRAVGGPHGAVIITLLAESTVDSSSKVSGTLQIDGTPAKRTVRAFGYAASVHLIDGTSVLQSKSLGQSTSDPADGSYTIDLLAGYGKEIFVVAFDDYGNAFTAEKAMAVGDRIHPTTPNGHVFECTGAGSLPAEEPAWGVDTETSQLYGTASMIAVPFYRPMVHGPVMPEIPEIVEPEAGSANLWRVYVHSVEDMYRISITELKLMDAEGTGDLAASIIPTTNSTRAEGQYGPSKMTDGDTSTRYVSEFEEVSDIWFAFDFGGSVNIGAVQITVSTSETRAPTDFSLEYSENGTDWIEKARWTYTEWVDFEEKLFFVP
jgi:hypothetical protein